MSNTATPHPLPMDMCPACGYALAGLPEEGRCPECGVDYRPGVIVLHGFGTGLSTAPPRTVMATVAINGALLMFLAFQWRRNRGLESYVLWGAYLLLSTAWALWKRWSGDMPAPVQIWLGPEGARQVNNPTAGAVAAGAFTPWARIIEVSITPKGEGAFKVKLVGPTTFWRGKQVMYAEVSCSRERAAAIREQIARWRTGEIRRSSASKLEAGAR